MFCATSPSSAMLAPSHSMTYVGTPGGASPCVPGRICSEVSRWSCWSLRLYTYATRARLAHLQLGERHDDLLHVPRRDPAALPLGDRKSVRALARVAQEGADAVHDLGVEDVLQLACARLELPAQDVVDETLADPVRADEPLARARSLPR